MQAGVNHKAESLTDHRRGCNPRLRMSEEKSAEGTTDHRQVVERSETPVKKVRQNALKAQYQSAQGNALRFLKTGKRALCKSSTVHIDIFPPVRRAPLCFGLTQRKGEKKSRPGVRFSTDVFSPQYKNKFFYIRLNENVPYPAKSWSHSKESETRLRLKQHFFLRDSHDCMAGYSTMAFPRCLPQKDIQHS